LYTLLHSLFALLQPEATSSGAASSGAAPKAGGGSGMEGGLTQIGLMAVMMVVFYLVLIRPQQKKQKELDSLLKALKKGQTVRTSSGIRGEIVDFKNEVGDEVVLMVADRVKLNVLRSHIAGVVEPGKTEAKS
jgi:preprotein translocase subunit YajC